MEVVPTEAAAPTGPSRLRRALKRIAMTLGVTIVVLALTAAALYAFGGMWVRTPEMKSSYEELVSAGVQPPLEARLVIPIPGCVCHSEDPVLQAKHSVRRINECGKCHERVGP